MKLTKVTVTKTIEEATALLETEKGLSPAMKAMFQLLLTLITLLAERLSLNSSNSSKSPSTDPNRKKKENGAGTKRSPGGQPGRNGTHLEPVEKPDTIIPIKLDKRTLPRGEYHEVGYEARQVVELDIARIITEYRAQVLADAPQASDLLPRFLRE